MYQAEDFAERGLPSEVVRAQLARILFEHVIDASPLIVDLLEASPHLKILVGLALFAFSERGELLKTLPPKGGRFLPD